MMDYQEAIDVLTNEIGCVDLDTNNRGYIDESEQKFIDACNTAISAMNELQLYKDGKLCLIPESVYSKQCTELDAYKQLGTLEEIQEALEKAEKYHWHDLRKNPEDLPDKLQGKTGMEFYETVQENHEHDEIRASYQYCDAIGAWGWWSDIYDPVTLGFVDTEFHELEEEGYEKVIAWREIEPFEED